MSKNPRKLVEECSESFENNLVYIETELWSRVTCGNIE